MIDLEPISAPPSRTRVASLLGDRIWAQKSIYTPPEPIDTSAQAEAKRERKRIKRRVEELCRRVSRECHFVRLTKGKGGFKRKRINVH